VNDLIIVANRAPFSFSKNFLNNVEKDLREHRRPQVPHFAEGGLVKAMASLMRPGKWNTTWIGASMGDVDIDVARGHCTALFKKMIQSKYAPNRFPVIELDADDRMHFQFKEYDFYMRFVLFDSRHMDSYYSRFANGFLWPLRHLTRSPVFYKKGGVFPRPCFEKNDFVQYTSSGVTFANTIIDEINKHSRSHENGEDVVIWNQDFHLMQISEVIKALLLEESYSYKQRKRIHVGQFVHTPFFNIHEIQGLIREDKRKRMQAEFFDPFSESIESVLQRLTWGMLSNDFIGFHTKEYCDHFLEAIEEWFPIRIKVNGTFYEIIHQNSVTTVAPLPIGLDVDTILSETSIGKELKHRLGRESLYKRIMEEKRQKKCIFGGLERRDYTKGLIERLRIFHQTFDQLKSVNQEAVFYQVTAPSRVSNPDYQRLNAVLEEETERLNRILPTKTIAHIDRGIEPPQNYRFMKEIDVMLVTPLDDGMNLVAFEFILSQKHKNPNDRGILVLSTSGASRVLKREGFGEEDGIVYINPMKSKEAAGRIFRALQEKKRLSEKVIDYVEKERRVDDWADKNIEAILKSRNIL
jgi:trehalose 6-phosphate synthase/phosphatase